MRPSEPIIDGKRRCSKCKQVKGVGGFQRGGAAKHGYRAACRDCCNARVRKPNARCLYCEKPYHRKPDRRKKAGTTLYCSLACAGQARRARLGFSPWPLRLRSCKQCDLPFVQRGTAAFCKPRCRQVATKVATRDYYRNKPAGKYLRRRSPRECRQCRQVFTQGITPSSTYCSKRCYRKAHPKSKWHRGISLEALGDRDGWRCHLCDRVVVRREASADHLIPRSEGGGHDPDNLALAHIRCNSKRGNRRPAQLRLSNEKLFGSADAPRRLPIVSTHGREMRVS